MAVAEGKICLSYGPLHDPVQPHYAGKRSVPSTFFYLDFLNWTVTAAFTAAGSFNVELMDATATPMVSSLVVALFFVSAQHLLFYWQRLLPRLRRRQLHTELLCFCCSGPDRCCCCYCYCCLFCCHCRLFHRLERERLRERIKLAIRDGH